MKSLAGEQLLLLKGRRGRIDIGGQLETRKLGSFRLLPGGVDSRELGFETSKADINLKILTVLLILYLAHSVSPGAQLRG